MFANSEQLPIMIVCIFDSYNFWEVFDTQLAKDDPCIQKQPKAILQQWPFYFKQTTFCHPTEKLECVPYIPKLFNVLSWTLGEVVNTLNTRSSNKVFRNQRPLHIFFPTVYYKFNCAKIQSSRLELSCELNTTPVMYRHGKRYHWS